MTGPVATVTDLRVWAGALVQTLDAEIDGVWHPAVEIRRTDGPEPRFTLVILSPNDSARTYMGRVGTLPMAIAAAQALVDEVQALND